MDIEYCQLTLADRDLVKIAIDLIQERYSYKKHHVSSAIRTKQDDIITGLHLDATVRRAAVCAEAVALGRVVTEKNTDLDTIVAVRHASPGDLGPRFEVVSPCGFCRELLADYAADLKVILDLGNGELAKCNILSLLPHKYRQTSNYNYNKQTRAIPSVNGKHQKLDALQLFIAEIS